MDPRQLQWKRGNTLSKAKIERKGRERKNSLPKKDGLYMLQWATER
jgi:hypothetical protein